MWCSDKNGGNSFLPSPHHSDCVVLERDMMDEGVLCKRLWGEGVALIFVLPTTGY